MKIEAKSRLQSSIEDDQEEAPMQVHAKARLLQASQTEQEAQEVEAATSEAPVARILEKKVEASLEEPLEDGVAFDTMIDGPIDDEQPIVQELTEDDGGVEKPSEQQLLMDDIGTFGVREE